MQNSKLKHADAQVFNPFRLARTTFCCQPLYVCWGKFLSVLRLIFTHFAWQICFRFFFLRFIRCLLTRMFKQWHTFLMGFWSGHWPGHSRMLTFLLLTIPAFLWHCWGVSHHHEAFSLNIHTKFTMEQCFLFSFSGCCSYLMAGQLWIHKFCFYHTLNTDSSTL